MRLSLSISSENNNSVGSLIECVENGVTSTVSITSKTRRILIQNKSFMELVSDMSGRSCFSRHRESGIAEEKGRERLKQTKQINRGNPKTPRHHRRPTQNIKPDKMYVFLSRPIWYPPLNLLCKKIKLRFTKKL